MSDPRDPRTWTATPQRLPLDWPGREDVPDDGVGDGLVVIGAVDLSDGIRLIHAMLCEHSTLDRDTAEIVSTFYAVYWCRITSSMAALPLASARPDGTLPLLAAPLSA